MTHPQRILLVRFRSTLTYDEVVAIARERADEFRALPGLIQKYYVQDPATGEYGGLYLWASPEALDDYRQSELRATIAAAYKVEGQPRIDLLELIMPLREG